MSATHGTRQPIGPQFSRTTFIPVRESWIDTWLETYALCVYGVMFLYVIFGIPGRDLTDTSQTDQVDPWNGPIWMLLLMMSCVVGAKRWRELVALLKSIWPLLLLFAYFTVSVTWALDPATCLRRSIFTYVQFLVIANLLVGIKRPYMIHLIMAFICCACAMADFAVYVVAASRFSTDEGFAGLQGQKNQAGLLMMLGYLSSMSGIFIVKRNITKLFLLGNSLIMCVLLLATRSSTSESVVVGATVLMPVLCQIARWPGSTIRAIAAVFVTFLVLVVFGYFVYCGFTGFDWFLPFRHMTFTARTDIWSFVIGEIRKRPWFGAGYSAFWAIDPAVQPSLKSDGWFSVYVVISEGHNGYIDQLATCGIVGLVSSLLVVFRTIGIAGRALNWAQCTPVERRQGMLTYPTAMFYLAYLLGFLLHNFTESSLFANNGALAVVFLITAIDLEKWRVQSKARHVELTPARRATMLGIPRRQ